jgi:hypothetical protein
MKREWKRISENGYFRPSGWNSHPIQRVTALVASVVIPAAQVIVETPEAVWRPVWECRLDKASR